MLKKLKCLIACIVNKTQNCGKIIFSESIFLILPKNNFNCFFTVGIIWENKDDKLYNKLLIMTSPYSIIKR